MTYDYDLFVIGAGSGGVRAGRVAASHGARVAVCEESRLGGTCVNLGCVPKKLLVYGSRISGELEEARGFGWEIGRSRFHWPTLIANKNAEIARLNGIYRSLLDKAGVTIVEGRGRVVGPHEVEVDGRRYSARHLLVCTGGHPRIPDIPGAELGISSNEVFFLEQLPQRVLVVGSGYIGVEFAGVFNGLGSETTLLARHDCVLRHFDRDAAFFLQDEMRKKGVRVHNGATVTRLDRSGRSAIRATLSDGTVMHVDQVLFATGRLPNTRGLGLEEVGVELAVDGAIVVDESYCTTVPSIFAVGDVTGGWALTPIALAEGQTLAWNLFGGGERRVLHYDQIPTAVFSQPELATVGLTESQARDRCEEVVVYKSEFRPMKHTVSGSSERTLMKLLVDGPSDRVVGAHLVGEDAAEIVQALAIALKAGATKAVFDQTIGIHPTAAEELVTMRTPSS